MTSLLAVGYGRTSTDKQETSCGQQREWAERKALALGARLAAWHQDEGIAGDVLDRPGLNALLDDLKRHKDGKQPVPLLLLFDQDRLSRATSWATGAVMERLMKFGVERLVTATEELDLFDDAERSIHDLRQNLTRRAYAKSISKNISRAMPQYAEKGCWNGGEAPYAYRIAGEKYGRHLVPGPAEEIAAAKELFLLAAEGTLSMWGLARMANQKGWPVPQASGKRQLRLQPDRAPRWTASTVEGILHQPAHVGLISYGRRRSGKYHQATADGPVEKRGASQEKSPAQLCKGKHEGIIDPRLFERVRAVLVSRQVKCKPNPSPAALASRKRRAERKRKGTRYPEQFLFRGKLTCARCGGVMHGCNEGGAHGYICGTWKNRGNCTRNGVHEAELLDRVADLLQRELSSEKTIARLRKRLEASRTGQGKTLELAVTKGKAHVAELARRVEQGGKRLLLVDADLLSVAQGELRRLKTELDTARADLAEIERQASTSHAEEKSVDELLAGLTKLPQTLRKKDPALRARAVQLAVAGIVMRFETWRGEKGRKMSRWTGATVMLRGNGPAYQICVSPDSACRTNSCSPPARPRCCWACA
jgi:site-specific DNA recombinase